MENGYQLETDSLGGSPVLRRLKNGEVIENTANSLRGGEERKTTFSHSSASE